MRHMSLLFAVTVTVKELKALDVLIKCFSTLDSWLNKSNDLRVI